MGLSYIIHLRPYKFNVLGLEVALKMMIMQLNYCHGSFLLGMQRYHFFRSDPIQKILSINHFRSESQFFFINVEFLYYCVTLLCVKHNLLDNFILMKNNMKII